MSELERYDVFLSHQSEDKAFVEALAHKLAGKGLRPFLDKWHLVPGDPWQEALEQALDDSECCAVFLGPNEIGGWQNEEMRAALSERVRSPGFRVIPVLIPGAVMPGPGELPRFLRRLTWVDMRGGLEDETAFVNLCAGIRGEAPGPSAARAIARAGQPGHGAGGAVGRRMRAVVRRLRGARGRARERQRAAGHRAAAPGGLKGVLASTRGAAVSLLVLLVMATLAALTLSELRQRRVWFDPILVPESVAEQGLSGEVLRRRLVDAVQAIRTAAPTSMDRQELAMDLDPVEIEFPGTGVTPSRLAHQLKRLFGRSDPRVGGELVVDGDQLTLRLRGDEDGFVEVGPVASEELAALVEAGARQILLMIDPFLLAAYLYETDPAAAREAAERSLLRPPTDDDPWAKNLLGLLLLDEARVEESIERFDEAIELEPDLAVAWVNLGSAYARLGDTDRAVAAHEKAVGLEPGVAGRHLALGLSYQQRGDLEAAIASLEKAVELAPDTALAHNYLGNALARLGRFDAAQAAYRKALEIAPEGEAALTNLRLLAAARARHDAGDEEWATSLSLETSSTIESGGQDGWPRRIRLCTLMPTPDDKVIEAALAAVEENPENAPLSAEPGVAGIAPRGPAEMAIVLEKRWKPGRVLKVGFLDGERALQRKVETFAKRWQEHVNLRFEFAKVGEAEIRISFRGHGSWSYRGTDALVVEPGEPTMNLGWLSSETSDEELSRVVLHEFGHVLGLIHEHQGEIAWDEPKLYGYYELALGWERHATAQNVMRRYTAAQTNFSEPDPKSIMLYAVPVELTVGGFEIPWNTNLSAADRQLAASIYPSASDTPPAAADASP